MAEYCLDILYIIFSTYKTNSVRTDLKWTLIIVLISTQSKNKTDFTYLRSRHRKHVLTYFSPCMPHIVEFLFQLL